MMHRVYHAKKIIGKDIQLGKKKKERQKASAVVLQNKIKTGVKCSLESDVEEQFGGEKKG